MEFFFFIIFCAVVGCLVYRVNTTTKNTEDIMSRFKYFASKYGLQPQDDNLFFGEFGGVPLSIKAVSASEYKTSLLHVKFKASHSNGNEGYLTLRPEMVGNKVGKLLGSKDLEIKDTEFDQRVWVETSDPLYARAYLSNEVRGLVLQLTGDGRAGFSVDKDEIRCDRTVDDIATGRQLEQIAELITRLAFLLSQD